MYELDTIQRALAQRQNPESTNPLGQYITNNMAQQGPGVSPINQVGGQAPPAPNMQMPPYMDPSGGMDLSMLMRMINGG